MTQELSDKEVAKLFNEVSNSLRGNDTIKLDELMSAEKVEVEEPAPTDESLPDEPEDNTPVEKEEEDKEGGPQDDKPADEPGDDDGVPAKKEESDEVSKLREQLAKLEKDNHSLRSQAGRVPHVQRRLQELDKKLDELTKKQPTPSSQLSDKILDKLKGIKETDPELADSIAAAIAEATSAVATESHNVAADTLKTLREAEAASAYESEMDRLLGMYPNAKEIFASSHWKEWKSSATNVWKQLASSDNADDVAEAFEKYAKDMQTKFPELANVSKEEPVVKQPPAKNEEAEKIEEERARKKATSVKVGSPTAPAKVSMPDDPDALFKKFSEQIRKERTG
jgi:ribosomal protein L10